MKILIWTLCIGGTVAVLSYMPHYHETPPQPQLSQFLKLDDKAGVIVCDLKVTPDPSGYRVSYRQMDLETQPTIVEFGVHRVRVENYGGGCAQTHMSQTGKWVDPKDVVPLSQIMSEGVDGNGPK